MSNRSEPRPGLTASLKGLEKLTGQEFFDYQVDALVKAADQVGSQARCLYYKTGAGKSLTALSMIWLWGFNAVVVIAPPSTHAAWEELGRTLSVRVSCMSHAKFRMKNTKLDRYVPVIADEFHLFGSYKGQGFLKLQRLARGLHAPVVLASATPNYNDAERCYCIESIVSPATTKGGILEYIYRHCTTEQNPHGMMPIVTGFHRFANAGEYLASLDQVDYLPDDLVYTIQDRLNGQHLPTAFDMYGYDKRSGRIMASSMEERHTRTHHNCVSPLGLLWPSVHSWIDSHVQRSTTPVLVYADHATIAIAAFQTFASLKRYRCGLVTGKTSKKNKEQILQSFRDGELDILFGTASLATGTDGLDKMCDTLLILDDTDDDSLRRQLIGRIMPRGSSTDASKKQVHRLLAL